MIEEEAQRRKSNKNYLQNLEPLDLHKFETDFMKKEIARIERREKDQRIETFDSSRYELNPPQGTRQNDPRAWELAARNSMSRLVEQQIRIRNLDLMSKYGADAWKKYNEDLAQMLAECQKQLLDLKRKVQEINWERKKKQTEAGEKLKILEAEWVALATKNFEIERACNELERELNSTERT